MSKDQIKKMIRDELISQTRCKGTVDGEAINCPNRSLDGKIYAEPRKQDVEKFGPTTKSRVDFNMNESQLVKLYASKRSILNSSQYNAGLHLLKLYSRIMPSTTCGYGDRVSGSGSIEDIYADRNDAMTVLANLGDMMDNKNYRAVQLLVIDDYNLDEVCARMGGIKGWSRRSMSKRMCEALDELSRILPQAKRMKRNERMVA